MGKNTGDPAGLILGVSCGEIAVDVFFITSGFLITYSFYSRNNILAFVWARILRIYPALIVAVLFCVFVVGLYFTTWSTADFLSEHQTYRFLKKNMLLFSGITYELPGVFATNPYNNAVNGSLWTLPYEIKMYTYIGIIAFVLIYLQKRAGRHTQTIVFSSIAVASVLLNIANHYLAFSSDEFIRLFSMFFVGVAFYIVRDRILLSTGIFIIAALVFIASALDRDLFYIAYCILLPYLLFYLAYVPAGTVRNYNKLGDYSYGMYIYAYPVQQSVAALVPGISIFSMIMIAFIITLVFAILSWHLVEKRLLQKKNSYVVIERLFKKS